MTRARLESAKSSVTLTKSEITALLAEFRALDLAVEEANKTTALERRAFGLEREEAARQIQTGQAEARALHEVILTRDKTVRNLQAEVEAMKAERDRAQMNLEQAQKLFARTVGRAR